MTPERANPTRIVSYYARQASAKHGGVNMSRQRWMAELAKAGFNVDIVTAKGGYSDQLAHGPRLQHVQLPHYGRGRMSYLPRSFGSLISPGDLLYLHEGWTPSNIAAAWHCKRHGIPYIVLPHGVYEPRIVETLKSAPGRHQLERWVLENARAVHLFFHEEAEDLRKLAPGARPVVAMTGMDIPRQQWQPSDEQSYIAWLGRYDVLHKGIDTLFEALAMIPELQRPRIEMRGPDYFGGKEETSSLARRYDIQDSVTVGPDLPSEEVLPFLLGSRAFVHVPRWEAYGRTIVESLALGVPVLLGDGARIAGTLNLAGAAKVVSSHDPASIAEGLAGQIPPELGSRGREWAVTHASWDSAISQLTDQLNMQPAQPLS